MPPRLKNMETLLLIIVLWVVGAFFATKWAKDRIELDLKGSRKLTFAVLMGPVGGLALATFIGTGLAVIGSALILYDQVVAWLDTAVWSPHSITDVISSSSSSTLSGWAQEPDRWMGVHKIFDFLHPFIGALMLLPIAMVLSATTTVFSVAVKALAGVGAKPS